MSGRIVSERGDARLADPDAELQILCIEIASRWRTLEQRRLMETARRKDDEIVAVIDPAGHAGADEAWRAEYSRLLSMLRQVSGCSALTVESLEGKLAVFKVIVGASYVRFSDAEDLFIASIVNDLAALKRGVEPG